MELFEAVSNNDVIQVMKLLEQGTDPNQFNEDNHLNALHFAIQKNAIDVVLLLITAGADITSVTEENMNIFDIARQHGSEEMMTLLLKICHMSRLQLDRVAAGLNPTNFEKMC